MQMVFQDPFSSLNPRMPVLDLISEPLRAYGYNRKQRQERVVELMELVGLASRYMSRYPHAFSGGQRQRIGIARALALNPSLIIADEAVSALDVSVQAQILNLLASLQKKLGLSYLFVAHDLGVVRYLCEQVAVMYQGRIVETGSTEEVFQNPKHPYTRALIAAAPVPDPESKWLSEKAEFENEEGHFETGSRNGCSYASRCPLVKKTCMTEEPLLQEVEGVANRKSACFRSSEV